MNILKLVYRNKKIVNYEYLHYNDEILDLVDSFFVGAKEPILSNLIPLNVGCKVKIIDNFTTEVIYFKIV